MDLSSSPCVFTECRLHTHTLSCELGSRSPVMDIISFILRLVINGKAEKAAFPRGSPMTRVTGIVANQAGILSHSVIYC